MALVVAFVVALLWLDPPWSLLVVAGGAAVEVAEAWLWWRWSRARRPAVGLERIVGSRATVVSDTHVRLQGELWQARAREPVRPGDQVEVVAVEGLTLEVVKAGGALRS